MKENFVKTYTECPRGAASGDAGVWVCSPKDAEGFKGSEDDKLSGDTCLKSVSGIIAAALGQRAR